MEPRAGFQLEVEKHLRTRALSNLPFLIG
jgi:hypothetical protein